MVARARAAQRREIHKCVANKNGRRFCSAVSLAATRPICVCSTRMRPHRLSSHARIEARLAPDDAENRVKAIWDARVAREGRGTPAPTFEGRRVLTLESRRAPELALLVMNYGGTPIVAPSVREVPLESNTQVIDFAQDVIDQRFGMIILMTGVGTRLLMKMIEPVFGRDRFIEALRRSRLLVRGPKPMAAVRELDVTPWATVPNPNTWRELLATVDGLAHEVPLRGLRIALQEYGLPNPDLVDGLIARGADVVPVPIYRWAMPEDLAPLRRAVWALVRREIDVVILTASVQLTHLLQIAREMGLEPAVRAALTRTVIASIGPMTSEELRGRGLPIDLESSHPKMGFLVKEAAEQCRALIQAKVCTESVR